MAAQVPPTNAAIAVPPAGGDEVFAPYEARSLPSYICARPHPGDIAEPASLAAVPLPATDYPLAFPPDLISSGKLSAMQLEGTIHACTKHLSWLPSGERAGFFIGDGAGTGKGRQISSVILDNYLRGRTKSVWISTSTDLYADAKRDLQDLGAQIPVHNNLQSLDKATNTPTEGVMFLTYSTLTSSIKGRSRLSQLIDWLGRASFDGVLVFDEAHKSKHYSSKENQGTKVATAVVDLQKALPAARVMYCSATGVSEVGNMAYMSRLGLFGPGSAFPTFDDFLASLKKKGISFMELLAMELKGDGFYVARGLSFRSAEFLELEIPLTPDQIAIYDAAVAAWTDLRTALTQAVAACGHAENKDPFRPFWGAQQRFFKLLCVSMKVPAVVKEAKGALENGCSVVIGLQSTGEAAADALNLIPGSNCGFISVTKELMLQFVHNHFPTTRHQQPNSQPQGELLGASPFSGSIGGSSGNGNANYMIKPEVAGDFYGNGSGSGNAMTMAVGTAPVPLPPVEDPTAVGLKEEMLRRIDALELPPNFLDELIDKLGGKNAVAEMTGRKARIVRDARGRSVYEPRAKPDSSQMDSLNIKEKDDFMNGKKFVAIVSDAASTGISLHADKRIANQRRRVHLTIELPWSADKAIQQLGRSHRSNQVSAPIYKLVFTDLGGERRFAAAVARRLQSLGALTRGDRRAASGLDLGALNYDSPLGRKALRRMYDAFVESSPILPPGVKFESILEGLPEEDVAELAPKVPSGSQGLDGRPSAANLVEAVENLHNVMRGYVDIMGIGLSPSRNDTVAEDPLVASLSVAATAANATIAAGGASNKDSGDVRRFLNRLLAVPVRRQRLLFNYFQLVLEAEIRAAKLAGSYTEGVSDLPGQTINREGPAEVLWTDPLTGLSTMQHTLSVDRGTSYAAAVARLEHDSRHGDRSGFYRSRRPMPGSGLHAVLLALQKPGAAGAFTVVRPNTGPSFFEMDSEELVQKYHNIPADAAQGEWEYTYESSLGHCMHGPNCKIGPSCHVGRRLAEVTLLTGSVVRIWDTLERVLTRHEYELSKADRTMRIVRVEGAGLSPGLPLIGLRYPGNLLPEVVVMLSAEALITQQGAVNGARAGGTAAGGLQPRSSEAPAPVIERLKKKAFEAPKTIRDFFSVKPKTTSAPAAPAAVGVTKKRPQEEDSGSAPAAGKVVAPVAKRLNSNGTGIGKKDGKKASLPSTVTDSDVIMIVDDDEDSTADADANGTASGGPKITTHSGNIAAAAAAAPGEAPPAPAPTAVAARKSLAQVENTQQQPQPHQKNKILKGATAIDTSSDGKKKKLQGGAPGPAIESSSIESLVAMGFSAAQAEKALKLKKGNVESAADWLLTNVL